MKLVLHIGNKNYSSWSLRPWLALRWAGLPFEERVIPLGGEGYGHAKIPAVLDVSPSGRVPVLHVDDVAVWDSLAICELANEQAHGALWPSDPMSRAIARSVVAEMHAGFQGVRRDLSMNIRRRMKLERLEEDTRADIARLIDMWTTLRERSSKEGPWLFGRRSIVDAFYAPVATRFRTYGIELPPVCQRYCETIFADEAFVEWETAAKAEPWTIAQTDSLYA
jgi:glutathione S-transferase